MTQASALPPAAGQENRLARQRTFRPGGCRDRRGARAHQPRGARSAGRWDGTGTGPAPARGRACGRAPGAGELIVRSEAAQVPAGIRGSPESPA